MQEGTVSETSRKEEEPVQQQSMSEPIQQQSMSHEPNVAKTKVQAEGHTAVKP